MRKPIGKRIRCIAPPKSLVNGKFIPVSVGEEYEIHSGLYDEDTKVIKNDIGKWIVIYDPLNPKASKRFFDKYFVLVGSKEDVNEAYDRAMSII